MNQLSPKARLLLAKKLAMAILIIEAKEQQKITNQNIEGNKTHGKPSDQITRTPQQPHTVPHAD